MDQIKLDTAFTEMLNIRLPIIAAPMFLVSNAALMKAVSKAGGIGVFPSLNYRPIEKYKEVLGELKEDSCNFGVNIIVNKSNTRQHEDLKLALDHGVKMFITSLGNPSEVIKQAHKIGAKVFCDVTNLEHAQKVQDLGADGVIAVSSGAGGHAGPISPLVLIPWLRSKINIPIIAAGGISSGSQIAAVLALGASAVSVGTRFIACHEVTVGDEYKQAIVQASPEDILLTDRLSGTPAAVIRTPYTEKLGDLPWVLKKLKEHSSTKKMVVPLIHLMGSKKLEAAIEKPSWKSVWSAGQSVGMIDSVLSVEEIFSKLISEYNEAIKLLPRAMANR